ncbi:MAG TPA: ABC transporter ATP-binding protein [Thermomicrobiales bacterium]|nr:ABC transporter ATP-binding protein [Thermomicrobiales bacterium]
MSERLLPMGGARKCYAQGMNDAGAGPAIATAGLTKSYSGVDALSDLSLTVERGSIYGFLGPNGAGKTTTIRLLMGFIEPTRGRAQMFGRDTWRDGVQARSHVGYLVQSEALFPELSGEDQLRFAEKLSGRGAPLQDRLLDVLELSRADLKRKLKTYSKGMRQKLALIAAAQHDPELLMLDEPTDGLDPLIQRAFESHLLDRHAAGRTIFMSSHDLGEVDRLCQTVAIVRAGRLVQEATIQALRSQHRRRAEVVLSTPLPPGVAIPGAEVLSAEGRMLKLLVDLDPNPLLGFLAELPVESITIAPPSLSDIFAEYYVQESARP